MPHISNHPHNPNRGAKLNPFADGAFVGEVATREALVDNGNLGASFIILFIEGAALEQSNPHGPEVVGADHSNWGWRIFA